MPIYDFKCMECGHKFDQMVASSDRAKVKCPRCGAINPQQLLSAFATTKSSGSGSSDPCLGCGNAGTGG